jgi:arylsulfatase A-like enzyme
MRGRLVLGAALAATLGVGVFAWRRPWEPGLAVPARIAIEDVVAELPPAPDRAAVVAEDAGDPIRAGRLEPGETLRGAGARPALVTPPPARVRWQVAVPADAALRFAVAVAGDRRRDPARRGVRFAVTVGDREVWRRVVDPAATRRDRRWFEERVDLERWAGRTVTLELRTTAERGDGPLAGTAGWSRVRVTTRRERDRQPARAGAPHVLVLLVDTLRADRLGCYGARPSPSPALDALAASGTVFERALAQASWTLPSVATLLTGLHPRSHGALGERERGGRPAAGAGAGGQFLADALVTWPEAARAAGLTTFGVSTNPMVSQGTNLTQGFETFVELPWDREGRNWAPAAAVNDAVLAWLAANRRHRVVAYLHYMEPHDPYTPPSGAVPPAPAGVRPALAAGWIRDAANAVNWEGRGRLSAEEVVHVRRLYDAEVRAWDDAFAALLAGLDRLGLRDSTVVVVTSDHGEEFQEHGRLTHGSHLYEESIRVPLVLAGPGVPVARRADPAQGIDLFPTLAQVLGLTPPAALPGRDLLHTPTGTAAVSETSRGIAPDGAAVDLVAISDGGWKLVRTPALARTELYDLARDPLEREDRGGAAPEAVRLATALDAWQAAAPLPPPMVAGDGAFRERLRALGYVR